MISDIFAEIFNVVGPRTAHKAFEELEADYAREALAANDTLKAMDACVVDDSIDARNRRVRTISRIVSSARHALANSRSRTGGPSS